MNKKIAVSIGILVVCAVLFFFAGPRLLNHIVNNAQPLKPLKTAAIKIKASGTVSLVDGHVVLTTPQGRNNYVLVGDRENELKQLANKKQPVFVFGGLMSPDPKKINNTTIRYRIDVAEFDTKDFELGQKLSTQVADSIKQKVNEKTEFREATLKHLGIDKHLDIVSGKLLVVENCIYAGDPKEHYGLMVIDKYGDRYFLYNWGGIVKPYDKYKKYLGKEMNIVVAGQVTLPDPAVTLPGMNYIPFSAKKIYNQDLSEFVVE